MASEKPAAAPAAADKDKEAAPAKKGGMKLAIAAGVVVVLEVATVFVTVKMSSGPRTVVAEPVASAPATQMEKDAEVKLIDASLPNIQSGRLFLYKFQAVAKVADKNKEKVTGMFAEKEFEIRDQIRTIIASSDPQSLNEPGLETIRRQVLYQLEQDLGKDLIKEVLIPVCTGQQMP